MAVLLPNLVVGQSLVGQAGEAKAGIADTDASFVITQNFGSNVDQRPLLRLYHPTR